MKVYVQKKGGRWGLSIRFPGQKERWKTIGAGDEGRLEAEGIAREMRRHHARREAIAKHGFLGAHPAGSPLLGSVAFPEYLEAVADKISHSSHRNVTQRIKNQLLPFFKDVDLRLLTEETVEQYVLARYKKTEKFNTVRNDVSVLRRVIHMAVRAGVVPEKVKNIEWMKIVGRITRAKGVPTRTITSVWSRDEARRILAVAAKIRPEFAQWVRFAFETGCRRGEIIGLKWNAVSLDSHSAQIIWKISAGLEGPPKWGKNRIILLSDGVVEMLRSIEKEQRAAGKYQRDGFVFRPDLERDRWSEGQIKDTWFKVLREVKPEGIEYRNVHYTRHSYASWALQRGDAPQTVANQLGIGLDLVYQRYGNHLISRGVLTAIPNLI